MHPAGIEPATCGSEDRTYDLIAPISDGNQQYQAMPRCVENQVSPKFLPLLPGMAGNRWKPPEFVVECDASVTGISPSDATHPSQSVPESLDKNNNYRYFCRVNAESKRMDMVSFVDSLAAKGQYHFTTEQAIAALGVSPAAARAAIRRLNRKTRVAMPFRGFHVIVPPEYRTLGCLPAGQFIPQPMEHLHVAYYAGLLTAASLHGAAHQAPMVFQVMVPRNRPPIRCGRVRVQFIARRNLAEIPTVSRNTLRGVLRVSSPEATAFDLVGYPGHSGGLSNVATLLSELSASLNPGRLLTAASLSPLPWAQRLGFLLERIGQEKLAAPLVEYVHARAKEYVPLRPRGSIHQAGRDPRWRLLVNEEVEPDL